MQYKDKLADPRWKKFSRKVREKDGYTCTFNCGWSTDRDVPLVAHHKVYYINNGEFVEPWDYNIDELITLCKTCHDTYHSMFDMPIVNKKTNKLINEDDNYRRTRLAIEEMKRKEKSNA